MYSGGVICLLPTDVYILSMILPQNYRSYYIYIRNFVYSNWNKSTHIHARWFNEIYNLGIIKPSNLNMIKSAERKKNRYIISEQLRSMLSYKKKLKLLIVWIVKQSRIEVYNIFFQLYLSLCVYYTQVRRHQSHFVSVRTRTHTHTHWTCREVKCDGGSNSLRQACLSRLANLQRRSTTWRIDPSFVEGQRDKAMRLLVN